MDERRLRARMLLGEEAMDRLWQSHVAVFGLGGVGSWCAEALCRSGIGELTLIDRDTVSESNCNRQLCALSSTLGQPKAEVMARRLRDIAPDCRVHPLVGHYEAAERDRFLANYGEGSPSFLPWVPAISGMRACCGSTISPTPPAALWPG